MYKPGFGSLFAAVLIASVVGCGENVSFLNPTFLNTLEGGQFPISPGPGADFVLVRVKNSTINTPISFTVTAEITRAARDENGDIQLNEFGDVVTEMVLESHR